MADSHHYTPHAPHHEPGRHHHEGHHHAAHHAGQDPRAPRTDAMSAAASGTLPPQDPSSHHRAHGAAVPDPGPGGDYRPASQTESTPPAGNLQHGERRHRGWSERMHELGLQAADPINALANKVGSQAFLPSTMDRECEKAASIVLSFCGT